MHLLAAAFGQTQKLLSGREGWARWRRLWVLAAIAGIAGAGAPPPPLGLLPALTADPSVRRQILGNPVIVGGLVCLGLFLLVMGGFGRAFTFAFLEGLLTGDPHAADYRKYLRVGALHFAVTAAVSAPLYALLFFGEDRVAHDLATRVTAMLADPAATPEAMLALLVGGFLQLLLVLVPWTLLTLPLMVFQYELLPAAVVWKYGGKEVGENPNLSTPTLPYTTTPVPDLGTAIRQVLSTAVRQPRQTATYLALRLGLQVVGNSAVLLATLLALPAFAVLGGPLLGVGWGISQLLGGPSTSGGAGALTIAVLLAAVVLYLLVCVILIPVAALIHTLALRMADSCTGKAPDPHLPFFPR